MKKLLVLGFVCLILFFGFGCLSFGENKKPPVQVDQPKNQSENKSDVKILITSQKNQTISQKNVTDIVNVQNTSTIPARIPDYASDPEALLGIYFIDVGGPSLHGNSILIKKGNFDVLVDAGPVDNVGRVVDLLRSKGVDDIDVLVSTNADPRNYGGINQVSQFYQIETLWWSGSPFQEGEYGSTIEHVRQSAKEVKRVERGFVRELNGIQFEVLNPPRENTFGDINNDALVIRVTNRNFSMLLTSGIQTGAQGRLVGDNPEKIKIKVMQAPYYGSGVGTGNIGVFLLAAKPETMIITGSADESAINAGSREPFKRLMSQYGIKWYETYKNGTIKITTDGKNYSVETGVR